MSKKCLSKKQLEKHTGTRVYVFKEIKNNVWTVWNATKTKKLFWTSELTLKDASFFVDEEKRQEVLTSQKRMPHAGIFGTIDKVKSNFTTEVYYNPFKTKHFKNKKNNNSIHTCKSVLFSDSGKVFVSGIES
jgi:hypothetical protein